MGEYTRFWDLHLTADDDGFDFVDDVVPMATSQADAHFAGATPVYLVSLGTPGRLPSRAEPISSRATMYVSAARLGDVDAASVTPETRSLVAWANDPAHRVKLRVHVHGDGNGSFSMGSSVGTNWLRAERLVDWLVANGLSPVRGRGLVCTGSCPA